MGVSVLYKGNGEEKRNKIKKPKKKKQNSKKRMEGFIVLGKYTQWTWIFSNYF